MARGRLARPGVRDPSGSPKTHPFRGNGVVDEEFGARATTFTPVPGRLRFRCSKGRPGHSGAWAVVSGLRSFLVPQW